MITSPRISTSSPGSGSSAIIVFSKVSLAQAKVKLLNELLDPGTERLINSENSVTISIKQPLAITGLPVPCLKDIKVERINNFSWEVNNESYNIIANLISVNTKLIIEDLKKINSNTPTDIKLNFLKNELKAGNLYRARLIWDLTGTFFMNIPDITIAKEEIKIQKSPKVVNQLIFENLTETKSEEKPQNIKILENRNPEIKSVSVKQVPTNFLIESYHSEDYFYFFIREITDNKIKIRYINTIPLLPIQNISDIHSPRNLT